MLAPTPRQFEVFEFVKQFVARHQRPPTRKDIAVRFGIRIGAAQGHIAALIKKRWLAREAGRHRAIRPIAVT